MPDAGAGSGRPWLRAGVSVLRSGARPLLAASAAALLATSLGAQQPVLRFGGATSGSVEGVATDGAASFPARALESLGFRLTSDASSLAAVLGADTVRFWTTSPWFRAGRRVHQLAFAVTGDARAPLVPEQFFIQWLPAAYPERFEYRAGALHVKGPVIAQAAVVVTEPQRRAADSTTERRRAAARTRVVVIDPGHGGRDPGRIGPNGLKEKEVTLMISQRLGSILRDRGYEVHLTRTTDTLIALADRPRLANRWKGERPVAVFLSIHANSAPTTTARGFETFFLSEARTEDERRVAEMENEAVQFEDHPVAPASNGLDQILYNLRSDFLLRASHDLATVMQEKLATFHPGPNRGVKRAGFFVLVGTIMPAVLIETAFISNRADASLLGTQSFQQKVAWGIADAVDEFFRRNEHLWVYES